MCERNLCDSQWRCRSRQLRPSPRAGNARNVWIWSDWFGVVCAASRQELLTSHMSLNRQRPVGISDGLLSFALLAPWLSGCPCEIATTGSWVTRSNRFAREMNKTPAPFDGGAFSGTAEASVSIVWAAGLKALDGGSLAPKSFQHELALDCLLPRRRQRVGGHKMRVYPEDLCVATSTEARKLSDMKRAIVATTVQSVSRRRPTRLYTVPVGR